VDDHNRLAEDRLRTTRQRPGENIRCATRTSLHDKLDGFGGPDALRCAGRHYGGDHAGRYRNKTQWNGKYTFPEHLWHPPQGVSISNALHNEKFYLFKDRWENCAASR